MNENEILKTVYKGEIAPNETKAFAFRIPLQYEQIKGVLFSPNTSLSFCLSDDKNLILEKFKYSYTTTSRIAPKDRILSLEASANNQTITGTIKNESLETKTISIYILLA